MPSMNFAREFEVAAQRDDCWKVVTDVGTLAGWVSILDGVEEIAPLQQYTAVLMDRLGPFKLRANLDVAVSEVDAPQHIRVQAAGEDRQVASRIAIDATVHLTSAADGGTHVAVSGSYEVVGRVATLGAGMIRQKATKILDEFTGQATAALGGA